MTATAYAALAALKAELRLTDTTDDTRITRAIESASRLIDEHCGYPKRHFWRTDDESVRYYTAEDSRELSIEDCISLSAIATDADGDGTYETTWTLTDGILRPANAPEHERPYTELVVRKTAANTFPNIENGVKLTGMWGWPTIPELVTEACLLQASHIFKRGDAPFGIAQLATVDGAGMRLLSRVDADVELMLHSLRRRELMA